VKGFVIGNGESRKDFDFNKLKYQGKIYGCNALYRDFTPDTLVVVDTGMVREITTSDYKGEVVYYDRKIKKLRMHGKYIFTFDYRGWAAGPTATWLLCTRMYHHVHDIYLLGFDFYSKNDKINNIYKDTECYRKVTDMSVLPTNWIMQFKQIFSEFRRKNFYRVQHKETDFHVPEFDLHKNYKTITYTEMLRILGGH